MIAWRVSLDRYCWSGLKELTDTEAELDVGETRERDSDSVDLDRELTSRGHDDDPGGRVAPVAVKETLDDTDPEGNGLSGSGPRAGDDVLAEHGDGDALALDRGRHGEVQTAEGKEKLAREGAVGKGGECGSGRGVRDVRVRGEVRLGERGLGGGGRIGRGRGRTNDLEVNGRVVVLV